MSENSVILVVEDNSANQFLMQQVLMGAGYQVEVAGSASEALEWLKSSTPALILMDIQLPGEDGLTLTRQLKAAPATASIPIIALTALAMKGDREAALAAGCVDHITKPIDVRTFPSKIARFLPSKPGGAPTPPPTPE